MASGLEAAVKPAPTRDAGSFRDPSGYVFHHQNQVYRTVNPIASEQFDRVLATGVIKDLVDAGLMIGTEVLDPAEVVRSEFIGVRGEAPARVLRHPKVPFISYPYEWTFGQLKDAALAHLDLQLRAFTFGVVLSDASSFNMQFHEQRVVHIDALSLRPYVEGEPWGAYNQFCRLFLLPLLIEAWAGMPFQSMLRGRVDGITLADAKQLLPNRRLWTSLNGIIHVGLHARLVAGTTATTTAKNEQQSLELPAKRYQALITEMRNWIASLKSGRKVSTYWHEYANDNSYSANMGDAKKQFITQWAASVRGGVLWDIGGNTGDFSALVLQAGAAMSVVLDSDLDCLEAAYARRKAGAAILPLVMDIADPSPRQGWNQTERAGLNERTKPDAVLALAVIHHLVIGKNLPLRDVVEWFLNTAPCGVIEFVPKSDPMVREMLLHREDVFIEYTEANFLDILSEYAVMTGELRLPENGRVIVSYRVK